METYYGNMERTEIPCIECGKKKLIHEKDNEAYCDGCGTEFILTGKTSYKYK